MIKILIVDDSAVVREFLQYLFENDPEIKVIGAVENGKQAVAFAKTKEPDIISMDINMPVLDGLEATRQIMESTPIPIVIVSAAYETADVKASFQALQAGALAILSKPHWPGHPKHNIEVRELISTIKSLTGTPLVRRWARLRPNHTGIPTRELSAILKPGRKKIDLIGIGASTGGPAALHSILSSLAENFPVPVLIVQHICTGFINGLIEWLNRNCKLQIVVARNQEQPQPGHVYLAPDGRHLVVGPTGRLVLEPRFDNDLHCPSVGRMFQSMADHFDKRAVGVLLTGMGQDGAHELKQMKECGAITIAQDEESCAIYGMPGTAVAINGATYVLPLAKIASYIEALTGKRRTNNPQISTHKSLTAFLE